ncbi:thioesterase [Streptomyces albus]|uniref:thioesterase II family protein n=1 Tax=Streptomyces albus TaxID=1888 RepID=UPI0013B47919|nr:alpha/beta fold hydrolase [Streptomyces albus]QID34567.1 thioesterase [Streptomyces albus]
MTAAHTPQRTPWLVPYATRTAPAYRMVCFPHAGGSASYYPWLREAVPDEGELYCLQYPGRQERRSEPPIEEFPRMVAAITHILTSTFGAELPLVLYGHSLGSALAFETARELEQRRRTVLGLIVSGRRAPCVRPRHPVADARDDESVLAAMRRLGGVEPAVLDDPDVRELILPALRADFRLADTYVPEPGASVRAPLTVLNGNADPQVSAAEAAAWHRHTTGGCAIHTVEGGHFFFHTDCAAVLAHFTATLRKLSAGTPDGKPPHTG